jgi:hypothetical protein
MIAVPDIRKTAHNKVTRIAVCLDHRRGELERHDGGVILGVRPACGRSPSAPIEMQRLTPRRAGNGSAGDVAISKESSATSPAGRVSSAICTASILAGGADA